MSYFFLLYILPRQIGATIRARNFTRVGGGFFQVPKDCEVDLRVVGDEIFQFYQNFWIGRLLGTTLGDALSSSLDFENRQLNLTNLY
jgi:uncharacterized membrane-anchored protein